MWLRRACLLFAVIRGLRFIGTPPGPEMRRTPPRASALKARDWPLNPILYIITVNDYPAIPI